VNCSRINPFSWSRRVKISCSTHPFPSSPRTKLVNQASQNNLCRQIKLVSLLQWHSSSMRWPTYPHRLTYQWTWSYVHMQIVSLLQWQAESWPLRWASRLVSLLQWHPPSMRWPTYPHRPTYQWTGLPRVHVQLVSLLQWPPYPT